MDNAIDYAQHTEPELVDMFGRLDPRYAPAECDRLGQFLKAHGYIVTAGETGPGSAVPSPNKLQELIGCTSPFECEVQFSANKGFLSFIGWTRNPFGFSGSGTLLTDGIYVRVSGRVADVGPLLMLVEENTQLACCKIANVESQDCLVRFEYNVADSRGDPIQFWLADATIAEQLVHVLPKRTTEDFSTASRTMNNDLSTNGRSCLCGMKSVGIVVASPE